MAKQQQQSQSGDDSLAPFWMAALVIAICLIIWYVWHTQMVAFFFSLNILQAKIVNFFVAGAPLTKEIDWMNTINPENISWDQLSYITGRVGAYVRYPVAVILFILGIVLYRSDLALKFRTAHNMFTLRKQEQHNWPAIMPVIGLDLVNQDINVGPWAMALSPLEFARKYQLLKKNDALLDKNMPGDEMTASIRRGDAKRIFTMQLGPCWEGFEQCPQHVQALSAVFMARMNRDRSAASTILESIDKTCTSGKIDYATVTSVLHKYKNHEMVQIIISKHAYQLTVLASLLEASRDDGVMPSAEFLWLKPIDRRLWYMLNCIGRQTPFVEVGGPFAHWRAEQAMGRRSLVPMIDEAIKALEIAVKEVKLSAKELQELHL